MACINFIRLLSHYSRFRVQHTNRNRSGNALASGHGNFSKTPLALLHRQLQPIQLDIIYLSSATLSSFSPYAPAQGYLPTLSTIQCSYACLFWIQKALATGRYRYQGLSVQERLCFYCKSLKRETCHSYITCPLYNAQRATLFTILEESIQECSYISEEQKFKTTLSDGNNVKQCASFSKTILKIRPSELMKP